MSKVCIFNSVPLVSLSFNYSRRYLHHPMTTDVNPLPNPWLPSPEVAEDGLHPDLALFLTETDPPAIEHPFVHCPVFTPDKTEAINEYLRAKVRRIRYLEACRDWLSLVLGYSPYYRPNAVLTYAGEMTDAEYWVVLARLIAEFDWMTPPPPYIWEVLVNPDRGGAALLMTAAELSAYQGLSSHQIPVWLGRHRETATWSPAMHLSQESILLRADTATWGIWQGTIDKRDLAAITETPAGMVVIAPIQSVHLVCCCA